jgi:hypothetical protein
LLLLEKGNDSGVLASRLLARLGEGVSESPSATDLVDVELEGPAGYLGPAEPPLRRNRANALDGPRTDRPVRFSLDLSRASAAVGLSTPPRSPLSADDSTGVVEEPSEDGASNALLRLRRVSSPFAPRLSEEATGESGGRSSNGMRRSRSDSLESPDYALDMQRMSSTGPVEEPQDGA